MTAYPSHNPVVQLTLELSVGQRLTVSGRDAWALSELIDAGMIGVTPIDRPAPRWAHYIFKLRGRGLNVETIDEAHGGAFRGSHARYVLRTPLTVIETIRQNDRAANSKRRKAVAA